MKKFIAFVLILLVSVSVGVTVFYFMRDNEELVVNSESFIYLNKGDSLEIDAKLENAKIGNELIFTSLNSSVLEWNPALNCFYAEEGGAAIIEIKAKNGKTSPVYIEVNIGNGMKEAPYYIDSEEDLLKIGSDEDDSIFEANDNYILMKDISLSSSIAPILNGKEFTGSFNGNGYTIKDLSLNSVDFSNAGLFATIGETGVVKELNLSNVNINGNYLNAGSIAGVNKGTITRCAIENGVVTSTNAEANVGGVCGVVLNSNSYCGRIDRCSSKISVVGTKNIGGLTGKNEGGILINSYCYLENSNKIEATAESANIGGIIGLNKNSNDVRAIVKNCYSVAIIISSEGVNAANNKVGSLIGFNDEISMYSSNYIMGLYANTTDIPTANHEFNLTFNENQKAEKVNFRGLTENFPKNESNVIKTEELISFVSKKSDNSLTDNLWDFTNVWVIDVNVNNGYPSLNKFGANVPDEIEITYDQSIISNKEEFIQFMQAVNNGTAAPYYKLNADIPLNYSELFEPIGTYKNPFNGTFDGNGHTISQVKISTSVIDSLSIKYVGLFGKISSSASIKNLTVEDIVIENGATYAGGIAGYNEGTIVNSQVKQAAKNKDSANISATYASGGIAGANLGTIDNCKVYGITVALMDSSSKNRFCGGISGLNGLSSNPAKAVITNSSVVESFVYDNENLTGYANKYSFKIDKIFKTVTYYLGGIAGANYYEIKSNYVYNTDLEMNEFAVNGVIGGIAGFSRSTELLKEGIAEVTYNKILKGTIKGHASAGLISVQGGIAEYNHAEVDNIYGLIVSGLANTLNCDARLRNCFAKSHLSVNVKDLGGAAGMVNYADYESNSFIDWVWSDKPTYGEFTQIFSACTFDTGLRYCHYESNWNYRFNSAAIWTTRYCGIGDNLIWEKTGNADTHKGKWSADAPTNNLMALTYEQAKLLTDADYVVALFSEYNFNLEEWALEEGIDSYPTLINIPEIEEIN